MVLDTRRGQAALFHARRARAGRLDPSRELFRTHRILAAGNPITDAEIPSKGRPTTFAFGLKRTDAGSTGVVFELGSATRGLAVALDGEDLVVAAGAAAVATGCDATCTAAFPAVDWFHRVVIAVDPNRGAINAWVDGQFAAAAVSTDGDFGGDWADTADGALGDVEGDVITRIPVALRVTLADAEVTPLEVFVGQLPRKFQAIGLGADGGDGSYSNTFDLDVGG